MQLFTIVASVLALASAAIATPAPPKLNLERRAATVKTFKLTGMAKGAAQVYLLPGSAPTKAHIFAVGTSFAATDYVTYATALANKGVVSVILDFSSGSTFKNYADYPLAIDATLKALKTSVATWGTTYNVTSFSPVASNIFLGGHSAGGWASTGYVLSNGTQYAGVISWDPVVGNSPTLANYTLTIPHLIANPKDSGCTGQISATNNGEYFYANAKGTAGTVLYTYAASTKVRHNSVTSSGFIGNLVCAGKVTGFQDDLATKVATFAADPKGFAAKFPGSTTGTFPYTIASK
ncbi:hypothetical protein HDU96_007963 [Phlyctochytrium bullatum]|nr:hypothetical protein HDU96_007963 [Phlyctochytrium bullatum]